MTTKALARAAKPELLDLDAAKKLLAAAKKPEDVKAIRDQAAALQDYARERRQSLTTQNLYGEIKLRGERRLGDLIIALPKGQPGRPKKRGAPRNSISKSATLYAQGVSAKQAREWQRIAGLEDDTFEGYIETSKSKEQEITTAGALRLAGGRVSKGKGGDVELHTPEECIAAVREALGGTIDLDPASSEKANRTIGAVKYFDEEAHGLDKPWPGRVYLFPPRGDGVAAWIDHLLAQHRERTTTEAVLLVDAATERSWFRDLWRYPICFTDRKLDFLTPKGKVRQIVTGSAFVYLGAHVGRFQAAFRELGTTVTELR